MKDTQIRALKAENGKTKRRAISNGLFIEARPSGKKVFIFRYHQKRQRDKPEHDPEHQELLDWVKKLAESSGFTYGSRRIKKL